MLTINNGINSKSVWDICGSFGEFNAEVRAEETSACAGDSRLFVSAECTAAENGVVSRVTTVKNVSDEYITFSVLSDKFVFESGEWDVYTQYNGWESESIGEWHGIGTEVVAESRGFRTNYGAAPFAAMWNRQSSRGFAFHLIPDSAWEIRAARVPYSMECNRVELSLGMNGHDLSLKLLPGESVSLPEIIFYPFFNKTDMDAWKLHRYMIGKYPRKKPLPIIYNSWLGFFDRFDYDSIASQVIPASKLGVEYFVVDAGWFGTGNVWSRSRGDWSENPAGKFGGRMNELADFVRQNGMEFGIWLELETANAASSAVKDHPEYYMKGSSEYLLDFANPEAVGFIMETVSTLIDKYGIKFLKLDFNSSLLHDPRKAAFSKYMTGYNGFLSALKGKYPDLYIERCASGGYRMNLADLRYCDSYWLSDDQNPQSGTRIVKDTVLRMPPQWIERFATIRSLTDFRPVYYGQKSEKLLAADDATWQDVRSVRPSFLKGFLCGGPVGFSCNLCDLSEAALQELARFVKKVKENREFSSNAECRILTDTETMLVLEYCDSDFERAEILTFSFRSMQKQITVYPVLKNGCTYDVGGESKTAGEIFENGITVDLPGRYSCVMTSVTKI